MRTRTQIFATILFSTFLCVAWCGVTQSEETKSFRWETDHFALTISGNAKTLEFIDKRTGKNHLAPGHDVSFCILRTGKNEPARAAKAVTREGDILRFTFPETPILVKLRATTENDSLVFDVQEISGGEFYSLQFARVPLIPWTKQDGFTATAMSRTIKTNTLDYPGRSNILGGCCFSKIGYENTGVFLLGMADSKIRDAMKRIVDSYPVGTMPVSKAGGPYAMDNPKNRGSYIITSAATTEGQVEELAPFLAKFGVDQIDFHQGHPFRQADFHFNEQAYPDGVSDFRKSAEAFRNRGMIVGLHTYAEFIDPKSKYVTPIPHKDLDVMRSFTLDGDITAEQADISVLESTADVSEITGFFVRNSKVLRIGDELILFGKPVKDAPWKFTQCVRGAFGTKATPHEKGVKIDQMTHMFSLFAPKVGSELFLEIARETAKAYNEGGFSMIYLDALDGTGAISDDPELTWYYDAIFVNEILKYTKEPPLLEYSTMSPSLWYGRSRMGAWDSAHRGYEEFFNRHVQSNIVSADRVFLPGQFGWLSLSPSQGDDLDNFQYNILFREDVDYLGTKILAHNYGLSFLGLEKNAAPFTFINGEILSNYDKLRRNNYFSPEILEQLKAPGKHFLLHKESETNWYITPARYHKAILCTKNDSFECENEFSAQVPIIRIEHRHEPAGYDTEGAIELLPLDENKAIDKIVTKNFDPPLDLRKQLGLGLWVFGDGKGQQVNVRVDSSDHLVSGHTDHFIDVNFEGWKYFSLAEAENGTRTSQPWPKTCNNLYHEFRQKVHFQSISSVSVMVIGPAKNLRFRTVKALPIPERYVEDPQIEIGNKIVTFTGKIKNGYFMECRPGGKALVYNMIGNVVSEMIPSEKVPVLPSGKTTIRFRAKAVADQENRVRVTLGTSGERL